MVSRFERKLAEGALLLGGVRSLALLLPPLLLAVTVARAQDSPRPRAAADGRTNTQGRTNTEDRTNLEGRIISRIDFDPPNQPLPTDELERLLPLRAGSPLKMDDVRATLQKLYETGRYSDVSVDAEPAGDGVAVRISTELNYFVGGVTLEGAADPPNKAQLLTAAKLDLGAPFSGTDVGQAIENMQGRLRANGLYHARIQYQLDRNPSTEEVGIDFDLDSGDRARFDGVKLTGTFNREPEDVIRSAGWRRGFAFISWPGWRQATENRVQSGLARVRQSFQREDRLQVRVTLDRLEYHDQTNAVTPTLLIDSGPIIQVRTVGAPVSRGRLRQLIPIYEERTVDRSLLLEGARNLVDYFQSQGYFEAAADFTEESETAGVQVIDYTIARNARHKLVHIELAGNRFFTAETVRERLATRTAGFLHLRYGRYSQKLRDRDRDSIADLYRTNGFRDVMVTATAVDDYQGRRDQIALRFDIQEGPQWFVSKLEMEGVSESDAAYLRTVVQSTEGQVYSEANIAADRDTILGFYFNNGYPNATFDWTETPGPAPARMQLHYAIRPGNRQFVRDVLVRGLDTTQPSLVQNRIKLRAADAISQSQIADSQQKLYDLGIFSKVQTALQNPDGIEERKYVLFQLDEANKYSFNVGVGAELARIGGGVTTFDAPAGRTGFSPRVTLGISRLNLLGLAHTLSLQTLTSTLEQRAVTTYLAPQFTGNENLTATVSALFDNSRDVRTFAAQRWEGSMQLGQRLSRANSLQYRLSYRRASVKDLKISPQLIPLLSQPVRVTQFSMSFIQDRRDDPVDTHRGIYNTIDAGVSLPVLGTATDFTRLLVRNSTYHRLSRDVVLARTVQFGFIQRLAGVREIPLAERFFAGGASSQRAFPDNQAGPRDLETGFPLGGTALLFHSTELRFPLLGDNVGGVLFHDMGNVYTDIKTMSFRFRQRNIQDFDYMVHAVGFGIRYRTPVGPIRVDFSFSPNSPRFHGFQGTLDQLLANQGTLTDQRINQFQFHFSLGQTF
ncbi:MAG TPA: BamA/TamA family outer membrane protein [Bryobacteraceae bacterium]|nr:BamA/TamA family outer membrane protein [Bryobacteraceae bacterium]